MRPTIAMVGREAVQVMTPEPGPRSRAGVSVVEQSD